jgi:hypothetical protein
MPVSVFVAVSRHYALPGGVVLCDGGDIHRPTGGIYGGIICRPSHASTRPAP